MAVVEDLVVKVDSKNVVEANRIIRKLTNTEYHLRRKIKRYKKYIKGLQYGIQWRNEVIVELAFRLGMTEEEIIVLSNRDFEKFVDAMNAPSVPNTEMMQLFSEDKKYGL